MDVIIEKKKGLKRKHIPYIMGGIFFILAVAWIAFGNHSSKLNVDKNKITIEPVIKGEFNDYIRINGQVLPINTVQVSAIEAGMVEEKLVEEGSMVRRGEVVVRLSNTGLNLDILNSEAQLAEKENLLRNTQITMQQERLTLRKEKLQLDLDVAQKERKFRQYERLYNENLVSKEEYLVSKEEYAFAVDSRALVIERQLQDSIYRSTHVEQMEEDLNNIRRNLVMVRQRLENLNVKAPVDGQLGLLDVEIGQYVAGGTRVGQVSVLTDYKIEASIDEHYIDRVRQELDATFDRQDKRYSLQVRKVYPEVRDKQFKTDFVFVGDRPDNIRAGQTYYINLQLGQPVEAVLIPRGTFYQTTGGQWIFVLTADGSKAVRRKISIGRQNPNYYEVTSGLNPGEQVIVSGYDGYGDTEELVLK